jgi:hypothetical protein
MPPLGFEKFVSLIICYNHSTPSGLKILIKVPKERIPLKIPKGCNDYRKQFTIIQPKTPKGWNYYNIDISSFTKLKKHDRHIFTNLHSICICSKRARKPTSKTMER